MIDFPVYTDAVGKTPVNMLVKTAVNVMAASYLEVEL